MAHNGYVRAQITVTGIYFESETKNLGLIDSKGRY